jgi:hypothetical protein
MIKIENSRSDDIIYSAGVGWTNNNLCLSERSGDPDSSGLEQSVNPVTGALLNACSIKFKTNFIGIKPI